jgi:fumarylacetoacetase
MSDLEGSLPSAQEAQFKRGGSGEFDPTTDPALESWVESAAGSDFPIQHLPYGAFVRAGEATPRLGIAIGAAVLDLHAVARAGLLDDVLPDAVGVFAQPVLNALLQRPMPTWRAVRGAISRLLRAGERALHDARLAERALVPQSEVRLTLPLELRDYVDFFSSLEHATNTGRMFRPDGDPLMPNWRWMPIGYHGRAGSVVVSGTPVVRPNGQRKAPDAPAPTFGPSRALDIELELAFVTGDGPPLGSALPVTHAEDHIFGVLLLNDWSARDIQAWEYQPLGPFLGKSFATSVAAWITPLAALEPFRVTGPVQEPPPLAYLATRGAHNFNIALDVELASEGMQREGLATVVAQTNFRGMYWSMAQQLAHLASNGARVRAGDLNASGTISGADPRSYGSLMELTKRGAEPVELSDGGLRGFLEDGDAVTLRGRCSREGAVPFALAEVRGVVLPALAPL